MSSHKLQPVRGTKDLFGPEIELFNHIIAQAKKISENFNFEEIQTPIFEFSEIFERNLGETSDIIAKEVYKFPDRSDNFLTLRPEFTAAIVRSFISNSFQQNLPKKLFSFGPIFRYDRPQRGRQRQFNQINFEIFGEENFYQDVEAILIANSILKSLEVSNKTTLELNSLGCEKTKENYEIALKEYFSKFKNNLSEDSKNRLEKNPLRILDSKDYKDIELLLDAPKIAKFYSDEAKKRFEETLNLLEKLSIKYKINENLVRGLDYYNSFVFEFTTSHEGAQNTVLAGGRYDNLVAKMAGKANFQVPAIGFGAGIERLMLLTDLKLTKESAIFVNYISENEKSHAFKIANLLRNAGFKAEISLSGNFKKQMKKSSQNNSKFVVIIGEEEVKNAEIIVKDFENSKEQKIKEEFLIHYFEGKIK